MLLVQSVVVTHCFPTMHGGHMLLPQSISVSVPFLTPSVHDGAWQTSPVHT
jgi:hypothetical protein